MSKVSKSFQDVEIWKKAHSWVLDIYSYSERFPKNETFGLINQLRRASVSVPANFVEGFRKNGIADKIRFYNIAQGSIAECQYYLILARYLGYGEDDTLYSRLVEIDVMLDAYIRKLKAVLK
jgi:four helix bundle protein